MIVNVLNISVASHFKFQDGLFWFARCHIQAWETLSDMDSQGGNEGWKGMQKDDGG